MSAKYFNLFLILSVFSLVFAQNEQDDQEKVSVTVYYESLCPDSIKFFTSQLYPTLQTSLAKHIDLELIPYGKASQTYDQAWKFECHHGPNECYGNKVQACAVKHIAQGKKSAPLGFNKVTTAFINCLMAKVEREPFHLPVDNCATLNMVENLNDIINCANSTEGATLLSELGDLTRVFQSPLKSVPTIVFNKSYKKEDNDLSQTNFPRAVCSYIKGSKPAECQKSSASSISSLVHLLVLPTFTIIYMH